jgi:phosphoadenosine phosphosulfate reductase
MPLESTESTVTTDLEKLSAQERILWAKEEFGGKLVMTTSFGIQSAVMLHLVNQVVPGIPVIFIDTGYLFPETYRFAAELTERLELNLKKYQAKMTAAEQEALFGRLWEKGLDGLKKYNLMNKVEPMDRAVREQGAVGWLYLNACGHGDGFCWNFSRKLPFRRSTATCGGNYHYIAKLHGR